MRKAYLQLHGAVLLAGLTGILGRLITLNELMIVCYRLLFTAITMWIIFSWRKSIHAISGATQAKIIMGAVFAASHWVTFYGAIKYANVSIALVCFALVSFFTALLEPLILRRKVNLVELSLGIVTLLGVYLIFHFDTRFKWGITLGVISAFLAALFPIINREVLKKTNVETLLAWQQTFGFAFVLLVIPLYSLPVGAFRWLPNWSDAGWLLVLSWLCSVWAFQLSGAALQKLSAFTVNLAFNLEPVYGILLAFLVYREDQLLSKWFYIGFCLIMAALAVHLFLTQQKRIKFASKSTP